MILLKLCCCILGTKTTSTWKILYYVRCVNIFFPILKICFVQAITLFCAERDVLILIYEQVRLWKLYSKSDTAHWGKLFLLVSFSITLLRRNCRQDDAIQITNTFNVEAEEERKHKLHETEGNLRALLEKFLWSEFVFVQKTWSFSFYWIISFIISIKRPVLKRGKNN